MYLDYFGFTEPPFSIAPDPRFLYMSERHREALAHLLYGIQHDGGFVLLTGEVGTGKTTVCRCLLEKIPEGTNLAFVLNPKVTVPELLATICDEFGIRYPEGNTSNKVFIDRLNEFLLQSNAEGRRSVLIIDEAQNLDIDVLEQVRLLTNLETDQRKLLQIIVLGQPELQEKLAQPELRQLAQRLTARYHLSPLSRVEMETYVIHRLQVAGDNGRDPLFSRSCFPLLFRLTNGIPRVINLLCDRALLGAYGQGASKVDRTILRKAASEILARDGRQFWQIKFNNWPRRRILTGAGVLVVFLLIFAFTATIRETGLLWSPRDVAKVASSDATANEDKKNQQPQKQPEKADNLIVGKDASAIIADLDLVPGYGTIHPSAGSNKSWPVLPSGSGDTLAFQSLLRQWGITFTPERGATPCAVAREHGLRCLQRQDSLETLRRFNRPAVLSLSDDKGGEFLAALISFDGELATFATENENWTVDSRELVQRWSGSYTMLWRPPAGYEDSIRPGYKGPVVEYIAGLIARIQQQPPVKTGTLYSGELVISVKEFQLREGLVPDGIVGVQTMILLQTKAGDEAPLLVPALSKGG